MAVEAKCQVYVCTACRLQGSPRKSSPSDGSRLLAEVQHRALSDQAHDGRLTVRGVSCMSNCNRPCSVAFVAPGKVSYIFGDLLRGPEDAEAVVAMAKLYAKSDDGITPWSERPDRIRRGLVARIPPFDFARQPVEPVDENS